jgi:hypothetical protein
MRPVRALSPSHWGKWWRRHDTGVLRRSNKSAPVRGVFMLLQRRRR